MKVIDSFYRKNDIGVSIEYTVIGYYNETEKDKYLIYTDFTTDNTNKLGIKIYVDKNEDGKYVPVSEEERKRIIIEFNKEATSYRSE